VLVLWLTASYVDLVDTVAAPWSALADIVGWLSDRHRLSVSVAGDPIGI